MPITGLVPDPAKAASADEKASIEEALAYMKLTPGAPIKGTRIDVAFLGSCTNGRLSDFQEVARFLKGRHVAPGVKAIAVPGSQGVGVLCAELGHRPDFPRRRLRMAQRGLLDVPRDEPGQAGRRPGLRELLQPQFQGPPGQPDRPHDPHEPDHGRGRRRHRRGRRRPRGLRRQRQLNPRTLLPWHSKKSRRVAGRAVNVPGNDIDTDRIIPARYLKCVTFDGLGEFLFYDVRKNADGSDKPHPLNEPRHKGATILLSGANFGCGSSREHAPQALQKYGFRAWSPRALPRSSYGNSTTLGMPCVTASREDIARIAAAVEADPETEVVIDLVKHDDLVCRPVGAGDPCAKAPATPWSTAAGTRSASCSRALPDAARVAGSLRYMSA